MFETNLSFYNMNIAYHERGILYSNIISTLNDYRMNSSSHKSDTNILAIRMNMFIINNENSFTDEKSLLKKNNIDFYIVLKYILGSIVNNKRGR
jgi:hypothetical protein